MLKFVDTPQAYPDVQEAAKRRLHFKEIYSNFDPAEASVQASRCSQCGVPFCQIHCPLSNNIPDWLMLTASGRLQEAYEISSATNTFPEICGRICPQDRLCEGNCVIEKGFESVTIGAVEKYITETAFTEGWVKPITVARESGCSVAVIGAGPAGLAAADALRRKGHEVHVYDRHDRVGGLLIYGIPNFKLEKEIVQRRETLLRAGGIKFHLNYTVETIEELQKKHDAILIATGVYKARELEVPACVAGAYGSRAESQDTSARRRPDAPLDHIIPALEYLTTSNRVGLGDKVAAFDSGEMNAEGKEVVVIGGGDTAMDCVRTAVRQGAKKVTCLYRRDRANMPGSAREVRNAEEEGVIFEWLSAPRAFVGKTQVQEIMVQHMRLLPPDAAGRQAVLPIEGDTHRIRADLVIKALGFEAEDLPTLWNEPALTVKKDGTLNIHPQTFMTALPGVYAAGDIVRGASLVVWAIRDGRDAAASIHRQLTQTIRAAA